MGRRSTATITTVAFAKVELDPLKPSARLYTARLENDYVRAHEYRIRRLRLNSWRPGHSGPPPKAGVLPDAHLEVIVHFIHTNGRLATRLIV
jgi:hypothetical protein